MDNNIVACFLTHSVYIIMDLLFAAAAGWLQRYCCIGAAMNSAALWRMKRHSTPTLLKRLSVLLTSTCAEVIKKWQHLIIKCYNFNYLRGASKLSDRSRFSFWATVCKTVRPMLSDRCPVYLSCSVLSVCK